MVVDYNRKTDTYSVTEKYDGQKYYMAFECDTNETGDVCYASVYLHINTKRKRIADEQNNPTTTGKHPFHTYKFCREAFEALMDEFILCEGRDYDKLIIEVHWMDNRRRDAYEKFLKKYGFTFAVNPWTRQKCLRKIINTNLK